MAAPSPRQLTRRPLRPDVGVIALVPDDWDSVWMPRQQVLTRLARYFDVVWINPAHNWREYWLPGGVSINERMEFCEISPGFTIMTPGRMLPRFYRPAWLYRSVLARTLASARRYLFRRNANCLALYLWRPDFADAIGLVNHDKSFYHVDDEYSFSDIDLPNNPIEIELLQAVDQVIVHSRGLLKKKGGLNNHVALVPNGVDYPSFVASHKIPPDLQTIAEPRIGYVGVIKRQLNLGLLVRLARARPNLSFVLVGSIGNVSGKDAALADLRALSNVYFLGHKPVDALPAYTQHMDVCLMCYEVNDYTNYIYPLKLHEYLAAGRPVVAAPIATILEHDDIVSIACTDEEWLSGIATALEPSATTAEAIESRRSRARQYDWEALVARIARIFFERLDLPWPPDAFADDPEGTSSSAPLKLTPPAKQQRK